MSIVAIDVGLKRIGVALAVGSVVMPQKPVLRKNRNQAARDVSTVLSELNAKTLVVGIPLGGSSEDEMRRRISHFVSLLNFSGEIVYVDEAMSSFEASEIYTDTKRDGKLDSIAAMIILKRYIKV
ncbi:MULTISPECIES: Holliday junction resolvase RuvX [unclassified Campylobacter]|uniref:Holliday junction resolvase RuvX n=1 Tax=unclassified Campylobacter TaxID=2593542 RepID=UPI00147376E5|nr:MULTISPECIES: Holliday junction resolvase RuvX [unclassified Campylobacter]